MWDRLPTISSPWAPGSPCSSSLTSWRATGRSGAATAPRRELPLVDERYVAGMVQAGRLAFHADVASGPLRARGPVGDRRIGRRHLFAPGERERLRHSLGAEPRAPLLHRRRRHARSRSSGARTALRQGPGWSRTSRRVRLSGTSSELTEFKGRLFFRADDGVNGRPCGRRTARPRGPGSVRDPWRGTRITPAPSCCGSSARGSSSSPRLPGLARTLGSDGTTRGTQPVADLVPGPRPAGSSIRRLSADRLLLILNTGHGQELVGLRRHPRRHPRADRFPAARSLRPDPLPRASPSGSSCRSRSTTASTVSSSGSPTAPAPDAARQGHLPWAVLGRRGLHGLRQPPRPECERRHARP